MNKTESNKETLPMEYRGWQINESDYGVGMFEAFALHDCDAYMINSPSINSIKGEIDDYNMMQEFKPHIVSDESDPDNNELNEFLDSLDGINN
tara:strand:- start:395 stop:673 length:279 start_codon:yes stop_codon:yes gene_type:complete